MTQYQLVALEVPKAYCSKYGVDRPNSRGKEGFHEFPFPFPFRVLFFSFFLRVFRTWQSLILIRVNKDIKRLGDIRVECTESIKSVKKEMKKENTKKKIQKSEKNPPKLKNL